MLLTYLLLSLCTLANGESSVQCGDCGSCDCAPLAKQVGFLQYGVLDKLDDVQRACDGGEKHHDHTDDDDDDNSSSLPGKRCNVVYELPMTDEPGAYFSGDLPREAMAVIANPSIFELLPVYAENTFPLFENFIGAESARGPLLMKNTLPVPPTLVAGLTTVQNLGVAYAATRFFPRSDQKMFIEMDASFHFDKFNDTFFTETYGAENLVGGSARNDVRAFVSGAALVACQTTRDQQGNVLSSECISPEMAVAPNAVYACYTSFAAPSGARDGDVVAPVNGFQHCRLVASFDTSRRTHYGFAYNRASNEIEWYVNRKLVRREGNLGKKPATRPGDAVLFRAGPERVIDPTFAYFGFYHSRFFTGMRIERGAPDPSKQPPVQSDKGLQARTFGAADTVDPTQYVAGPQTLPLDTVNVALRIYSATHWLC